VATPGAVSPPPSPVGGTTVFPADPVFPAEPGRTASGAGAAGDGLSAPSRAPRGARGSGSVSSGAS
jgi:hypothetical protein